MNSSTKIAICRLQNLFGSCSDKSETSDINADDDLRASVNPSRPDIIYALFGKLKVAAKKTELDRPPYEAYPGSLLFVEQGNASAQQQTFIRCYALEPQTSWFDDSVYLLLTSWRLISHPKLLKTAHVETLAFIEIIDPPLIISQSLSLPKAEMQLSWWLGKRIQPEFELYSQLHTIASSSNITNGRRAAKLLLSGYQSKEISRPPAYTPISILGTVSAVCISDNHSTDSDNDVFYFIIDLAVEAVSPVDTSDSWGTVSIPVMFSGYRFLGLYASLVVGDSLFVTCILSANIVQKHVDKTTTVFCTTAQSQAFRIDEFEGMDGSQRFAWQPSPSSVFTHCSQQSLLSQIELGREPVFSTAISLDQSSKKEERTPTHTFMPATQFNDRNLLVHQEKLESYEGVVSRMLDMALGIYVIDSSHILVLRYWPQFHPLLVLRPGTRVLLDNVHVVLLANSEDYHWSWLAHAFSESKVNDSEFVDKQRALVFGACTRSSVRITGFAPDNDPGTARLMANCDLTRTMTKRVEGLVQMIETMEAFWKFSRKFPNGPVSARHTADSEGQLMSLAMLWTGAARSSPRNKLIEFLAHNSYCQAARAKTTARVLTLEKILQRLKKRLGSLKQNDYLKDNSNSSSSVGAGSTEVVADGVSSADLQLQAVPLIGRLVVSERGELFLWDSTGHLLVHPSFVSGISHPNRAFSYKDPVFAGQMLIGHLYAWNNWRFMIETIDVMSIGKIGDEARISRSGPSPDFRLVYAAISNPVVLIADPTFGGLVASSGRSLNVQELSESDISLGSVMQEREQEQEQPLCLVLFVHWQGMAAPTASQEMQQATKQGCADGSGWRARVAVRGASLKIDYSSFKDQLQNAMDDKPQINIDLSKNGALGNQWESCFIHFTPSKVPAKFASNCAYVICVSKKSRSGYLMSDQRASQNLFFVKLGSLDRVYPVHLSINGQQADTGIPPIAKQLPVATINVLDQRVNSNPISRLHAPRSFSIKEIHDALVSEAATTGSGIAGRLISVYGIVVRRKVRDAVEFVRTNSDNNRDMQSNPLVAGMFENVIVLSDESDMSLTITLYIKLYTFAHPLGLLPGACIEFQNLTVGVSKTSSQIYLTSTNLTTIQHVPAQPIGSTIISSKQQANAGPESKPSRICIGELYIQAKREQLRHNFTFICQIAAIEHLGVSVECKVCSQIISNMSCLCIKRCYRMVDRNSQETGYSSDATTVNVHVELLCRVIDGSGMARVAVSSAKNVVRLFDLSYGSLEELYEAAAKSWNGQLIWKQDSAPAHAIHPQLIQQQYAKNAQESDLAFNSIVEQIVSRAGSGSILVHGFVVETQNGQALSESEHHQQQVLRIDGRSIVIDRHAVPRIFATQVKRLGIVDSCWDLLENKNF